MAVQIMGVNPLNIAEVDPTFKALRIAQYPRQVSSAYATSFRATPSAIIAANSELFQFRNTSATQLAVINHVTLGYVFSAAPAATIVPDFDLVLARNFTVDGTGGTAVTFAGDNGKLRTSQTNAAGMTGRINTGTALGAGTKTLDTFAVAALSGVATTTKFDAIVPVYGNMFLAENLYPIVLAQNEGFVVRNITATVATAAVLTIGIHFSVFDIAEFQG